MTIKPLFDKVVVEGLKAKDQIGTLSYSRFSGKTRNLRGCSGRSRRNYRR